LARTWALAEMKKIEGQLEAGWANVFRLRLYFGFLSFFVDVRFIASPH
jgi:hypothetical protein